MSAVTDNTALFRARTQILCRKAEGSLENEAVQVTKEGARATGSANFPLYCAHARQILMDVTELRDLVLDKRKEYILCSNAFSLYGVQKFMSDEDRRKFDRELDLAFKHCTKLIKGLEVQIESDRTLRRADELRHLLAVSNLLNIYLKEVLTIVTQLREIHVRKSRQMRRICRLANLVEMYGVRLEKTQKEEEAKASRLAQMMEELREGEQRHGEREKATEENKENVQERDDEKPKTKTENTKKMAEEQQRSVDGWEEAQLREEELPITVEERPRPVDAWEEAKTGEEELHIKTEERPRLVDQWEEVNTEKVKLVKGEQAQLLEENKKLFERFTATDSELVGIETQMSEIQRLQGIFAEKISEQEQDIDIIHSRTVYTLDNLETANEFIREAIKNQANRRVILIFCLLVLTFTLLFLDWYNP
uniref:Syntaxin-18 n=1 Tax=Globodera pallida TaxID=36090 RepID=A0A183C2E1_GLOPA